MVLGFKSIVSQLNQNQSLNERKKSKSCEIMDNATCRDVRINKNKQDQESSPKECLDKKSNNELLRIPSNSNGWWPNDVEEKLESRQRWSFGSDISIEAVENIQNRLCCSPVDEFDSTVSSETEDLIVNNTEEEGETYESCIQLSPACSPTFKNIICDTNGQKQRKSHDVYTDDDELVDYSKNRECVQKQRSRENGQKQRKSHDVYIDDDELVDYSKRYTTDSSGSVIETKSIDSHIQRQQQQNKIVINNISRSVTQKKSVNTRSKGYPFGDYAETDLDQPTDYSLRYAEEDTDEEEKDDTHFYCSEQPEEDIVKTYYTEGTPSNFSTATSMSDLLVLEDSRENDEVAYKPQFLRDQKQEIIGKSEKSPKDCRNRIRQKFLSNDPKIPTLEKIQRCNEQQTCDRKMEKLCTPLQSPAEVCNRNKENKAVTFSVEENNYAQETPLMFSRCSSLDSLSEFDQVSIQDDRSSIISDFSHRTSEAVSPSELPDSPTQTVPPSPRRSERDNFSNLQHQQQEHQLPRPVRIERESIQSLRQQQPMPPPPSQIQRAPIRPLPRNSTSQPQSNSHLPLPQRSHGDGHASLMQCSSSNGQVPLIQRPQMNNRIALMQRPPPEGRVSLVQRSQSDGRVPLLQSNNRMPIGQRTQIENRGPVVQRPPVDRLINTTNRTVHVAPSPREPQLPQHIPDRCISVFEDNLVRFKTESMQGKFSTAASSLSSLTIDDEDDNVSVDNREMMNRIMSISVRSSAAGMHQAPCTQRQYIVTNSTKKHDDRQPQINVLNRHPGYRSNGSHVPVTKEEMHYVNVEDESHDYTTSYSNKEVQNNRYRNSPKEQWYENELKNDNRKHTINKPNARSPNCNRNNNEIICHLQKQEVPEITVVDTLQTYCTEDTPIFVSPYGSQSNLSGLSSLSMSDDGDFGYGLIENERAMSYSNFDEAERSNSRVESYDESEENSDESDDEDDDKNYEGDSSLAARRSRRIDVSPFDSQVNLNFSLLRIEEEDEEAAEEEEEEKEEETNNETERSPRAESLVSEDDDDDYRRLSCRNSDCSDDEVLEQCIKSGVSKVTRRSLDSRTVP